MPSRSIPTVFVIDDDMNVVRPSRVCSGPTGRIFWDSRRVFTQRWNSMGKPGLERTLQTNRGFVLACASPVAAAHCLIDTHGIARAPGAECGSIRHYVLALRQQLRQAGRHEAYSC
jgi:hypothetical protein